VADEANSRFTLLCESAYKGHHARTPHVAVLTEKKIYSINTVLTLLQFTLRPETVHQ